MLYWRCVNCWFTISSKKIKHEIWNTKANLPAVLMMCELLIYNITKGNEAWATKTFYTRWRLARNTEVNLPAVLLVRKYNIIKHEEQDRKLLTSYWLTTNTEVNLHAVLKMCELLIHNTFVRLKIEGRGMKQFTS